MALGTNIMLGYNDFAQGGSVYASNTAMNPSYPLSNALLPDLFQPAIFAQASSPIQFTIDLGSQKSSNLIALLKHNINYAGKWRIYLNADIVNDPLGNEYDSGWMSVIPATPSYGALPWGQFNWGDSIPEYNLGIYNRHAIWPLPNRHRARLPPPAPLRPARRPQAPARSDRPLSVARPRNG